jgi:putative methionine-R-sulfoxide reductase with GAF domain
MAEVDMLELETQATGMKKSKAFEDGKISSKELLKENERLRLLAANLRNEKRDLANKYIKVEIPRLQEKVSSIEDENRQLREENKALKEQFSAVEKENLEFAEQYVEIERQNSSLVNTYVASYQLHATLNYREVVRSLKEIIINLIGSEQFHIYIYHEQEQRLVLIAQEGLGVEKTSIPITDALIAQTIESGEAYVAGDCSIARENGEKSVACIPMKVGEKVMGVIVIGQLLNQKDGFQEMDHELFDFLCNHAATAIYGAHLYSQSEHKRGSLEEFITFLKEDFVASEMIARHA